MNGRLRTRLARLETTQDAGKSNALPQFLEGLYGLVKMEELAPETREFVESLHADGRSDPDPIEARIRLGE